ncbi:hypothetical protein D0809_03355 [Flavobacterium circumlabens]|uniref:Virulence plasmid B protein n=1 Tax=Flavobacterium circumlabens TaxID=2133765 RepID=A0A4Y7UI26_9FLAO|nr:FG-GAP-like repeat-containing protein [Flavobacterium circumlabens]TCN60925.1 virulence plasmid B protein [Flavobacterium circumlabens]TEB46044.1 hypothetical protein D0809_03355 [Flavobacterium circumlabens]
MKQFYFSILFLSFSFYISAQTTSTEVGTTEGQLTVSLTGNANYTIPIAVPPGINGVEPEIGLSYNSQKGLTGTAASGWDISGVSSITRIPSTKLHDGTIDGVDFDALDRFALNGQRLIRKDSTAAYGGNGTVYETEYYSNVRVTSYGVHPSGANYGPEYFLVEYPDGSKELYGNSADSRSVAEWAITYWENAQGVRINYKYSISSNSLILESVKYGTRGIATPINEIQFTYEPRYIPENYYIAGTNIKRDKNLTGIKVIGNGVGYRNYALTYQSFGRIKEIVEKSGDNTKSYNPTVFEYEAKAPGEITYIPISTTTSVGNINSLNAATVSGDFDEDGKMDFLLYPTTGPDAKKKFWPFINIESGDVNIGAPYNSGAFDEILSSTFLSSGGKVMPQGWTLVQGNVFTTYAKSATGIYAQYQKTYTFPQFTYYSESPLSCIKANTPRIATTVSLPKRFISGDFNGDGLTDIAAIELNYTYSYLGPCDIYGEPLPSTSTYLGYTYFVDMDRRLAANFTTRAGRLGVSINSVTYVADFNGDGKSDIYVFDLGKVKVYSLNDSKQFELLTQFTDTGIDTAKPILIGDYNGDGKSDFMIPKEYGNYWYSYNSTGAGLLKEENMYPFCL